MSVAVLAPHSLRPVVAALCALALVACNDGSGDDADAGETPVPAAFSVGGEVSGLDAGNAVVLRNNGGDALAVKADGTFAFGTQVTGAYSVTVARQPWSQECTVADGAGTATADVTNVKVACVGVPTFVTTLAGNGVAGTADGRGAAASFDVPAGVALDASGNLYVADFGSDLLRRVTAAGDVTTVATGLADPVGVAVGPDGNIYVASRGGNKILRVTPGGTVSTLAGSGAAGGLDGSGTSASFDAPYGVAFDGAGNLYVSEVNGHRVRKITPAGDVSTLAGTGVPGASDGPGSLASFNIPYDLAVDSDGVVYVADGGNRKIRRIALDGTVSTLAGTGASGSADGAAAAATFELPFAIELGADGALYIADFTANKLRRISSTGMVSTIAGTGTVGAADGPATTTATLNAPAGIALDADGNLFFTDSGNHKLRKLGR